MVDFNNAKQEKLIANSERSERNGKGDNGKKVMTLKTVKKKETLFLISLLAFPIVQFIIFYIILNINSICLAFQEWDEGKGKFIFTGLDNFGMVFDDLFQPDGRLRNAIKNSTIQFLISSGLGIPLHIVVSYAIFKEIHFSKLYKVLLVLPSMISSMVFVVCARHLLIDGMQELLGDPGLNLLNPYTRTSFWTVLWFGFWMQFSSGMIIYLGAMSNISVDVMEYSKLEGLSTLRELWSIVLPLIYPTITTYVVVAIAGFFTNQGYYFSFMGAGSLTGTTLYDNLAYVFFTKLAHQDSTQVQYPYAAAGGLLFTLILAPLTFLVKYLMEKYGPSEE